jgi:hypothetical protein
MIMCQKCGAKSEMQAAQQNGWIIQETKTGYIIRCSACGPDALYYYPIGGHNHDEEYHSTEIRNAVKGLSRL